MKFTENQMLIMEAFRDCAYYYPQSKYLTLGDLQAMLHQRHPFISYRQGRIITRSALRHLDAKGLIIEHSSDYYRLSAKGRKLLNA